MEYSLVDLIDIDALKQLCEKFTKLTQACTAVLDLDGTILVATGWQDICTQFHRVNLDTASRCNESDITLAKQLHLGEKYNVYKCKNGLIDVAVPIIINENHVGNLFSGQFFFKPPEKEHFSRQAIEFGFEEDSYFEALSRVPIFTEEQIKLTMDFLCELAQMIGTMGLNNLRALEINEKLSKEMTKRNQAAEKERESKTYLDKILNNIGDPVFVKDDQHRMTLVNDSFCSTFGRPREEIIGKTLSEDVPPNEQDHFLAIDRQVLTDGQENLCEESLTVKGGKTFTIITRKTRYVDKNGDKFIIGVIRDITERKKAENALRESEARFKKMIEKSPLPMVITDQNQDIVFLNDRFTELFGYTLEDISTGEEWWNAAYPDLKYRQRVQESWQSAIEKAAAAGTDIEMQEWDLSIKDGTRKRCEFYMVPLVEVSLIIMNDISKRINDESEKKKLELRLQQAEKMESIGTLAGGIAHDFNNILGAILGYAEMVHEDCPPNSEMAGDIEQIIIAGNRASELVKQILTFSRQAEIDLIPVKPAIIIKEAMKMLRASLPTTIAIELDIDEDAGSILADPTNIHQILMNLCTNASHAMEKKGGTLTISLQKKMLSQQDFLNQSHMQQGNYIQLSIRDTGVGISPEIKEKIFDPYFTTKEVGKGTGMGLAMVHGIMQSSGGSITCTSRLGEGALFQVTLPIVEENHLHENMTPEIISGGNEHILLIDDEKMLAEMVMTLLKRLGYRVTSSTNSIEALTIFRNQPEAFDLIITDHTMPGMTGVDLARIILQIRPDMPIILCTGYSSTISEDKAKSMGIKGFAMKPLAKKDIAVLIRKVLDIS